jgi:hypothetical protein
VEARWQMLNFRGDDCEWEPSLPSNLTTEANARLEEMEKKGEGGKK